jgi:hypothetical protein
MKTIPPNSKLDAFRALAFADAPSTVAEFTDGDLQEAAKVLNAEAAQGRSDAVSRPELIAIMQETRALRLAAGAAAKPSTTRHDPAAPPPATGEPCKECGSPGGPCRDAWPRGSMCCPACTHAPKRGQLKPGASPSPRARGRDAELTADTIPPPDEPTDVDNLRPSREGDNKAGG